MRRILFFSLMLLSWTGSAFAAVEVALQGNEPVTVQEVYLRDSVPFLALDDLLPILGLSGEWDSVEHVYRIHSPRGTAVISPGSHYLRQAGRQIALEHQPRFIDGRLRVSEDFLLANLPPLLERPLYYRNLNPVTAEAEADDESPIDRLFAFLLRKRPGGGNGPALQGVALDPGHGGQDPGTIGEGGSKEKTVTLEAARRLEKLLKMRLGIPVFLTRDGDYAVPPEQRLATAAQPEADAFVVLHAQAAATPDPRGITLYVRPQEESIGAAAAAEDGGSLVLARNLSRALEQAGLTVSAIRPAPLIPLGRGNLPTVLVELGYLSNPEDRVLLTGDEGQSRLAEALFEGLRTFAEEQKEMNR